jgi:hypothetical protein
MPCPYCGYEVRAADSDRRDLGREVVQKGCDILKGEVSVPVRTVDLSTTGVGIKMKGYLPFNADDTVDVQCSGLDIARKARVVWTKKFYGLSRAGLMFCEQ